MEVKKGELLMKKSRFLGIIIFCIFFLTACLQVGVSGDTFRVGMVVAEDVNDGDGQFYNAIRGVELAAKAKKTILGKNIEIEVFKTSLLGEGETYKSAINNGVQYFINAHDSLYLWKGRNDIGALLEGDKGLLMRTNNSNTDYGFYTYEKITNVFNMMPSPTRYCESFVQQIVAYGKEYLNKNPKDLRIGFLGNLSGVGMYDSYYAKGIKEELSANGLSLILNEYYGRQDSIFSSLADMIREANLDFLLCDTIISHKSSTAYDKFVSTASEIPFKFYIRSPYEVYSGHLDIKEHVDYFYYSFINSRVRLDLVPGLNELIENYRAEYGEDPTYMAIHNYSIAMFLFDIIEEVGTFDVEQVRKAIESADIEKGILPGYWGVKFDENNNNVRAGEVFIVEQTQNFYEFITDLHKVVVGPDEFKTNEIRLPTNRQ